MKRRRTWIVRAALLAMVICVLLCLGMGAVKTPEREIPPAMRRPMNARTAEERVTMRLPVQARVSMADVSLNVREVDDFLLTPALLVQEAVSDGVVLTYPEE